MYIILQHNKNSVVKVILKKILTKTKTKQNQCFPKMLKGPRDVTIIKILEVYNIQHNYEL